jgi:ABC-type branched-subunit amino acid transport system ATPase component
MDFPLCLTAISAAYKNREVIRQVSLRVKRGETLALIGPNGAGKSTLIKIIAGYVRPSVGDVLIDGQNVVELEPYERARLGLGYFMQGGRVFSSLTVKENLTLAALRTPEPAKEATIRDTAAIFDLNPVFDSRAGKLSGGWKQRLALAMVLVSRPSVLLLDEPSAGLSSLGAKDIFVLLDQYRKAHNITILLVEQNVDSALNFANIGAILVRGEIAAETDRPHNWIIDGQLDQVPWLHTVQGAES